MFYQADLDPNCLQRLSADNTTGNFQERSTQRSCVRSAMRPLASYLEGDRYGCMMHLHVNQKSDYDIINKLTLSFMNVHARLQPL